MHCTVFKNTTSFMSSPLSSNQNITLYNLPNTPYRIHFTPQLATIQEIWKRHQPAENIFLQTDYLLALEKHIPTVLRPIYVLLYDANGAVIGLSYMQIFKINVAESIKLPADEGRFWKKIKNACNKRLLQIANVNILVSGNLLLTGQYGYYFAADIAPTLQIQLIHAALETVSGLLKAQYKENIQLSFIKDFPLEIADTPKAVLAQEGYLAFMMQPGFRMPLRENWRSFDDYLGDMQSKYRVRAKSAHKKFQGIEKRELTYEEIQTHLPKINELYLHIAQGAIFNAFTLHSQYFLALKGALQDNFKLVGYFLKGELVAFSTAIFNGKELEAHFLGVAHQYNQEYKIYLNILYDLIQMGIYYKFEVIDFARTAAEIKSSVGAIAGDLYCFLKHHNPLLNPVMKWGVRRFNPKEEWQPRHPFKENTSEATTENK